MLRWQLAMWVLASCAGNARPIEAPVASNELPVPDVRQSTDYTCSASALQGVLAYYGIEAREDTLARELGATPADGAPPDAIARVAKSHGLDASVRDHMTVEDLAAELAQRRPIIIDLQAWSDKPRTEWASDWEDGHYAIVIAMEGDQVVLEDPSTLGSRAVLGRRELEQRWHAEDNGRKHIRTGIVFRGKQPAPPPARVHLD